MVDAGQVKSGNFVCYLIFLLVVEFFYHDCIVFVKKKKVRKTSCLWMAMRKVKSESCPSGVLGGGKAEEGEGGGEVT